VGGGTAERGGRRAVWGRENLDPQSFPKVGAYAVG